MSPTGSYGHEPFSVTTEGLSKRFNHEWIFRDLSMAFYGGKKYALTSSNGSGKSTLLQVLWGQMPQTSGDLQYRKGDKTIESADVHRHVSIATPYMDLIEEFTLREILAFHFRLKPIRAPYNVPDLAREMYLDHALDKPLSAFSSGMKQRVKLGLACFTEADIYFLDEPGTNLDAQAFSWYRKQLDDLPAQALVFIASNNPDEYPASAEVIDITRFKPRSRQPLSP